MIIRRSVAFERKDIECVQLLAKRKGLGVRGFSTALRMIIREWSENEDQRKSITDSGRHLEEEK